MGIIVEITRCNFDTIIIGSFWKYLLVLDIYNNEGTTSWTRATTQMTVCYNVLATFVPNGTLPQKMNLRPFESEE